MTGTFWIISYVLLAVGALAALSVAFAAVRELGILAERVQNVELSIAGDFADPQVSTGIRIGSQFPKLELTDLLSNTPVRIDAWPQTLLLHVVASDRSDVAVFAQLPAVLPPDLQPHTVVSAVGGSSSLWEIAREIAPSQLVHDSELEVDLALGTRFRPYAVFLMEGKVMAARPFGSPEDLGDFVAETRAVIEEFERAAAKEAS
jgi:hypothetical protein